jgi:hypothetical protein
MYQGDKHATPDMMRAAFSNYRTRGVDGLYTWALDWPHGEVERNILVEQGISESFHEGSKHYFVPKRLNKVDGVVSYKSVLPLAIDSNSTGVKHEIPLYISSQLKEGSSNLIRLRMFIRGLVNADYFVAYLNGVSIMAEASSRYFHDTIPQEVGRWVEFVLDTIQPQPGNNVVGIELLRRGVNDLTNPSSAHGTGLIEPFIVEEVEILFD